MKVADEVHSGMAEPELSVIAGALSRNQKPKATQGQDAIAKRWRMGPPPTPETAEIAGVIPLLNGWIRRLEREAGSEREASP